MLDVAIAIGDDHLCGLPPTLHSHSTERSGLSGHTQK